MFGKGARDMENQCILGYATFAEGVAVQFGELEVYTYCSMSKS